MQNFKLWMMALCLAGVMSPAAFAADGSSGCGPGWYIFKENSLVSSALRATTNGILFPVMTIGMTVGTSNCTQHKIVTREKESLHFATMNHFELKRDIAKGEGEYLSAFGETLGCPASVQPLLNQSLRQNMKQLYPTAEVQPETMLLESFKSIFSNKELTNKCSLQIG